MAKSKSLQVNIEVIPHSKQRYDTCGDYWIEDNIMQIRVSDIGNADYEFLVAIHEFIEAYLCLKEGIDYEKITEFDKHFEKMRTAFPDLVGEMEPGDHDNAPYQKEHKIASMMEKWLADNMKIDFEDYTKKVNSL